MESGSFKFKSLAKEYSNFFAPTVKVKINGDNLIEKGIAISDVNVKLTCNEASNSCTFVVKNAFDPASRSFNSKWMKSYFDLGSIVEVEMGYVVTKKVFYGYISMITQDFVQGDAPGIEVTCLDVKTAMSNGYKTEATKFTKYSDVVSDILNKYKSAGLIKGTEVDDTPDLGEGNFINQVSENDLEFVKSAAKKYNYRFFTLKDKAYFIKMPENTSPVITLEWGVSLLAFNRTLDLTKRIKKVIVISNDEKKKKVIQADASSVKKIGEGKKTPDSFSKVINGEAVATIIDSSITTQAEAKNRAEAMLNKESLGLVNGKAKSIGLPEITPARYIEMDGLGDGINNKYFITDVTHSLGGNGYITEISFEVNAI